MKPVISVRLSASPLRSPSVRVEHRCFRKHHELDNFTASSVFDGNNLDSALVTRFDSFSYGHGAAVATIAFPLDADDALVGQAISAVEDSIRVQAKKSGHRNLIALVDKQMPAAQEYRAILDAARQ